MNFLPLMMFSEDVVDAEVRSSEEALQYIYRNLGDGDVDLDTDTVHMSSNEMNKIYLILDRAIYTRITTTDYAKSESSGFIRSVKIYLFKLKLFLALFKESWTSGTPLWGPNRDNSDR